MNGGNVILDFLRQAGPVIIPLMVLAVVIDVLALWNALALIIKGAASASRRQRSIDAILFWGGVAAILGFLGQWIGVSKMIRVVVEKGLVSPQMVVLGLSESLLTPVSGMVLFVLSAFFWFFLRLGLWAAERRT